MFGENNYNRWWLEEVNYPCKRCLSISNFMKSDLLHVIAKSQPRVVQIIRVKYSCYYIILIEYTVFSFYK